jgi:hypothetical protein
MARKKAIPTVQVRVGRDVAQLASIVAAYRETQMSDLLSDILRPVLQKMHAQEIAKTESKSKPKGVES